MTLPLTPGPSTPTPLSSPQTPAPSPAPLDFPLGWLLDRAGPPIQFRSVVEVARLPMARAPRFALLPYVHAPALRLAMAQSHAGTWSNAMLTVPPPRAEHFQGVGTINAVRRLLEYGWDQDAPPIVHARRILFRLLAEDEDPAYLFELAPRGGPDPEVTHYGRTVLREAAAAALAQAGYEKDPRLRGAAHRILERVDSYLRSPLAEKPFVRAGNQHVLAREAAPPSIFTLVMLAFMPFFRSERYDVMDRLYQHLSRPMPRALPAVLIAKRVVPQPHLMLGDPLPHRNAADADIPWALTWLELVARLQFLRRSEGWSKLFERFVDDRGADAVWRPSKGSGALKSSNPFVWPSYPLEEPQGGGAGGGGSGDERWTDVNFRLGLIARLSGRQINVV